MSGATDERPEPEPGTIGPIASARAETDAALTDSLTATLASVVAALPGGGEARPGQRDMAVEIGRAHV